MKSTDLTGTVRMAGEADTGIRVEIHLDDETMRLVSPYGELGRWPLSGMGISARIDGFHIKVEGEELVLSTNDDARFAVAVGLRSANSPRLVRQLAHARDDGLDVGEHLTAAGTRDTPPRAPNIGSASPTGRQSPLRSWRPPARCFWLRSRHTEVHCECSGRFRSGPFGSWARSPSASGALPCSIRWRPVAGSWREAPLSVC